MSNTNYCAIVPESFEERYQKYLNDPELSKGYMEQRLKTMPIEELAYLLTVHDKFYRIICKEYEDEPCGYDPIGRWVDPWGRPCEKPKD